MRILTGVLVLLRFLQTAAYISLFFFSLIKLKEPKKKRIIYTVALCFVITFAYFGVGFAYGRQVLESLIMPAEIALCLGFMYICSADRWAVLLFVMFTQFSLLQGISYISDVIITKHSDLQFLILYLICRTVLFGALLFFNFKYLRPRFRRLVETLEKEWYLLSLVAFSFYVLETTIQFYPRIYWYETDLRWYLVASSYLVFFCIYWMILWTINAFTDRQKSRERESILAMQNKMWEEQIEEQKLAVNSARRDRHDLRHHYDTLLTMLEGGKTLEVMSYLNVQTQRIESAVLAGVCEHLAANAILSRWEARARENGIITEIDARIPANLPMDEVALVGILANAFENAVEGCLRCPDGTTRYITVKIAYSVFNGGGKLRIVVENPCTQNIVFENSFPKSQKPGGGTGTKSITYTAERYNGMVEFAEQDGVFRTRVLLHL